MRNIKLEAYKDFDSFFSELPSIYPDAFFFREKIIDGYFSLEINQSIWQICLYPPSLQLTIFSESDCKSGQEKMITSESIEGISDSITINLSKSKFFVLF